MRKYLKELREKFGFTQLEVARKLDISESYYNLIENRERLPKMTMDMAMKLANIFKVSINYIFENENN